MARLALLEAWAWSNANGLLIPDPDTSGQSEWRVLTRRARKIETEAEFANFKCPDFFPRRCSTPRLLTPCGERSCGGQFDVAAFHAMKGVEVAVRATAGFGNDLIGTSPMRKAFAPQHGPLTDMTAEGGDGKAGLIFSLGPSPPTKIRIHIVM